MKEGWTYKKLGEVCEILNGFAFQSKNYVPEGIRVVRITNVQKGYIEDIDPKYYPIESKNELSRYLLKDGDLLLSLTGNVGRVAIIDCSYLPAYLNQRVACIRVKENVSLDLNFLFHLLYSKKFERDCIKSSKGAAQLNMSTIWLASYLIPVPSIEEQRSIVARLDAAFAHFDALKANAEKQLAEARQLFQAELSECMRPKEGWEEKKMSDFFEITSSKRVFQKDWTTSGIPFYRAREIVKINKQGFVDNELFITEEMYEEYKKKYGVPQIGDILITGVGTLGVCYVIKDSKKFYYKDGNIIWLKKKSSINSDFVTYQYLCPSIKKQIYKTEGATVGTYTITNANDTKILVPSIETQNQIVSHLDALSANIKKLEEVQRKTLAECDALKQAMLREVFE